MITLDIFLLGLMVISTLTGLVTEAVKKILTEHKLGYHTNTLAGIVATVLSVCIGIGYIIVSSIPFTSQIVVYLIALVFMSWLCSMVGYDKVIELFNTNKKGE